MAFLRDNQTAYISDFYGNIRMIRWQSGASSGDDFDFSHGSQNVCKQGTFSICLTKDEKYLLVGSDRLVSVFETTTREVKKDLKLTSIVRGIRLIKDGKKALLVDYSGHVTTLDLETLEISSVVESITEGRTVFIMVVI